MSSDPLAYFRRRDGRADTVPEVVRDWMPPPSSRSSGHASSQRLPGHSVAPNCRSERVSALRAVALAGHPERVRQRSVRPLNVAALAALTTERLLAYRSRLLELEESASTSDLDEAEWAALDPALLPFKDEAAWIDTYASVKAVLAERERSG